VAQQVARAPATSLPPPRSCGMGERITSFNIYISHVKKIQNEERGTSPRKTNLISYFLRCKVMYECMYTGCIHTYVCMHVYL
jgi:hypothetical protein